MTTNVVIMAGGRGLRLRELTDHAPKSMVAVGAKPMLQSVIEHYVGHGFKKFVISVGYKADVITAYFGDGQKFGASIKYVREDEPLGTGGALRLLPEMKHPFIVCNADVLSDYSPGYMMADHALSGADMTMAIWRYEHQIRYGVAVVDETQRVVGLDEKPIKQWPINAGIYVLNPSVLQKLPDDAFDMTDLMGYLDHVHSYPLTGQWHDVGTLADLDRAQDWRN